MSSSKTGEATPRPWAIYDYGGAIENFPKDVIVAPTGESIAQVEGGWPQCTLEENEANAKLIVEAVNSYDALQAQNKLLREACKRAAEDFAILITRGDLQDEPRAHQTLKILRTAIRGEKQE